ncbi:MurR/RpiR family transcriptional regulator [Mesomycoplasma neurolyticum]|uniref:GntR family transcriptional regulator n=1 Tax=Mesomycoplasma neurolyticum TaxID=2120 RepID=A0A449A4Z5_9BACT|nr:MurR/RpiR family transcriptional regulator [Mesomycoplasma neurolyticum]VEU59292.1 GntR family transcriptional regulator [Mesomycoplasma neurolyticum]
MNKIVKILDEKSINLSTNEKIINDFINDHTDKFISMPIQELSRFLYVSIGSITRYVKKNGFQTFKELKNSVIKEQQIQKKYSQQKNTIFAENINLYYKHSIDKTLDNLNKNDINMAFHLLRKSQKICCYGISSSSYVAREMVHNLLVIGKDAALANTIHDVILYVENYKKNNCVVLIFSKSMSSKENKFILDLLEKYGIQVILITKNINYKSTKNKIVIHFQTLEQDNRIIALSSKISELFISDILLRKLYLYNDNVIDRTLYSDFKKKWN